MPAPETETTVAEKTTALLDAHNIPYGEWGKDSSYQIEKLIDEISSGEAELIERGPDLIREVTASGVAVYYRNHEKLLRLYEAERYADGRVLPPRDLPGSVGEKRKRGEGADSGAQRAIREELGIAGAIDLRYEERFDKEEPSELYYGLIDRQITDFFVAYLSREQFLPEFWERRSGKLTHFTWKPVDRENHRAHRFFAR